MQNLAPSLRRISPNRLGSILLAVMLLFFMACGDSGPAPEPSPPSEPETFTFFDIGRNSRFSDSLRNDLRHKLGNDAIERRSIIDLDSNYRGFLAAHLPELETLNRRLNHPPGERVDHDVIKLMYRYARKQNLPFDHVELVFDGQARSPLFFRIRFKADETGLVDALQAKHGTPQTIDWEREDGRSLIWRKEQDVLMASLLPDAFGGVDHHLTIYFTENLNRWVEFEQTQKEKKSRDKSPAGKSAF